MELFVNDLVVMSDMEEEEELTQAEDMMNLLLRSRKLTTGGSSYTRATTRVVSFAGHTESSLNRDPTLNDYIALCMLKIRSFYNDRLYPLAQAKLFSSFNSLAYQMDVQ
jgi:hypothetical protein